MLGCEIALFERIGRNVEQHPFRIACERLFAEAGWMNQLPTLGADGAVMMRKRLVAAMALHEQRPLWPIGSTGLQRTE